MTTFKFLANLSYNRGGKLMKHLNYEHQNDWDFVSGQQQSPIALTHNQATIDPNLDNITLSYENKIAYVRDTGASIEFGLTGTAQLNHRTFNAVQAHIHTPGEHTIDGQQSIAELHLVHQSLSGQLAVVAVPINLGSANPALSIILDHLPTTESFTIPLPELIDAPLNYLNYIGSLTTPPLTENVEWYIIDDSATISTEQLDVLHKFYNGNNRALQPNNNRPIQYHC